MGWPSWCCDGLSPLGENVDGYGRSYKMTATVVKMISSFVVGRCPSANYERASSGCFRWMAKSTMLCSKSARAIFVSLHAIICWLYERVLR